jgi:hypothetical protein
MKLRTINHTVLADEIPILGKPLNSFNYNEPNWVDLNGFQFICSHCEQLRILSKKEKTNPGNDNFGYSQSWGPFPLVPYIVFLPRKLFPISFLHSKEGKDSSEFKISVIDYFQSDFNNFHRMGLCNQIGVFCLTIPNIEPKLTDKILALEYLGKIANNCNLPFILSFFGFNGNTKTLLEPKSPLLKPFFKGIINKLNRYRNDVTDSGLPRLVDAATFSEICYNELIRSDSSFLSDKHWITLSTNSTSGRFPNEGAIFNPEFIRNIGKYSPYFSFIKNNAITPSKFLSSHKKLKNENAFDSRYNSTGLANFSTTVPYNSKEAELDEYINFISLDFDRAAQRFLKSFKIDRFNTPIVLSSSWEISYYFWAYKDAILLALDFIACFVIILKILIK